MQKILYRLLFAIFLAINGVSGHAVTETLQWYVDNDLYATTTCESGGDITLPTAPTKYGYTFQGWTGYTKIEYLESNGTQYINTLFSPTQSTRVIMQYMVPTRADVSLFGARVALLESEFDELYTASLDYRSDYGTHRTTPATLDDTFFGDIITVDKNANITTLTNASNNIIVNTYHPSTHFTVGYPIFFPGIDTSGTFTTTNTSIRIYSFKIYNDNGNLTRDMIPVLDSNNIPCMYDLVENKYYYNAGTGDFIAGPMIYVQ